MLVALLVVNVKTYGSSSGGGELVHVVFLQLMHLGFLFDSFTARNFIGLPFET